jgi:hypothetical protein
MKIEIEEEKLEEEMRGVYKQGLSKGIEIMYELRKVSSDIEILSLIINNYKNEEKKQKRGSYDD